MKKLVSKVCMQAESPSVSPSEAHVCSSRSTWVQGENGRAWVHILSHLLKSLHLPGTGGSHL
jgi:hypothetical protein